MDLIKGINYNGVSRVGNQSNDTQRRKFSFAVGGGITRGLSSTQAIDYTSGTEI
jgi:hypothetical protein